MHRGYGEVGAARGFLDARLSGLTPPDAMAGRAEAAARLADAARRAERVVVFGDYDVDGTTSAAILADVLEALGAEVAALVANRFDGGYGLSDAALDRCLEAGPAVLVTCDCGSSDHERIARAKARGVDVVVIDHHLVPSAPLPADAFLNPHRPECGFPYKGLASAGLALSIAAAVRAELGSRLDVRGWLDLVALGTVADVAPLDGDNRRLVRAGLRALASARARPGVAALRSLARLRPGAPIGGRTIAFKLAPRLNAPGRLGEASVTLELLRARDPARARTLAREVERLNDRRKVLSREATDAAMAQVEAVYGAEPAGGVVVGAEGWHPGVVGIVAARLADRFRVPVAVLALDGRAGQGSVRGDGLTDVHACLARCAESLELFGGHRAAAGMSIRPGRFEAFRDGFAEAVAASRAARRAERVDQPSPRVPVVDATLGETLALPSLEDLQLLEPLGEANPAPLFALAAQVHAARAVGADGSHLKLELDVGGRRVGAFAPGQGGRADALRGAIWAVGELYPDDYRGGDALELSVEALAARD